MNRYSGKPLHVTASYYDYDPKRKRALRIFVVNATFFRCLKYFFSFDKLEAKKASPENLLEV